MADPIIKKGSTGPAVKKAQQNLIIRHYFPLTDDGVFGPVTRARVIQYQSDRSAGESRAFSCFKRPFQGSVQVVPGRASTLSIRKSWLNLRKRFDQMDMYLEKYPDDVPARRRTSCGEV
jgi:peptidoglycan hydrolase-like protein with peptidoglycan-binding domain